MAKRERFFVDYTGNSWKLEQQGASRAVKTFETKEEAIDFSRPYVRERRNSQLVIKKKNHKIQTEHTYDNDPRKTPG